MSDGSRIVTRPPELGPQVTQGAVIGALYVNNEDSIACHVWSRISTLVVIFIGRLLRPDGQTVPVQQYLTITADNTEQVTTIDLSEGYLLSAAVYAPGGFGDEGDVYVSMSLFRGRYLPGQEHTYLSSGYVTRVTPLSWPNAPRFSPLVSGAGSVEEIAGTSGGATTYTWTVQQYRTWQILCVTGRLITSAVAGNRVVLLTIRDPTNIVAQMSCGFTQAASQDARYTFGQALGGVTPSGGAIQGPLPIDLRLRYAWNMTLNVFTPDAGDVLSDVRAVFATWVSVI